MHNESPDHHEEHDPNMETAVLEEDLDPDYEPSHDEIIEYAKYLGMDLDEDKDFIYIAKEGLQAPLPDPWKACRTRDGQIYYFNFESAESQWDHPLDDLYRKKFQETKALFNKKFENREEQKFQKQLQKQQKLMNHSQPSLQRNTSTSNIADHSNISGLSYSHHNSNSHVQSDNKRHDHNGSSHMDIGKEVPIMEIGKEENESINFSDLHLEEEIKWKGEEKNRVHEEIENEYQNALCRYEEQLNIKFTEAISDYETQFQEEAQKLDREYQIALKRFKEEIESEKSTSSFESKKKEAETQIRRETERDVEIALDKLTKEFTLQAKKLESENENEIEDEVFHMEEEASIEIEKNKEDLETKINEIQLAMEEKEMREQEQALELVKTEERLAMKKTETLEEFSRKLKEVEQVELTRMAKELENFQKELEVKLEREKKVTESSRKQYQEHFADRRVELSNFYGKKLNEERQRLSEENEKSIREALIVEKKKAEENAEKKAETHAKSEYDRKYNSIEVEKLLIEQQSKKRLEEVRSTAEKKFEQDKTAFVKETEASIVQLKEDLNSLDTEITHEENNFSQIQKINQESEVTQKEIKEKEIKIIKLQTEISQLQREIDSARAEYDEITPRLNSVKQAIVIKNHIMVKVDEIYRKIEEKETEIETIKQKQAEKAARLVNETINSSIILPSNNISKILKEIEDIKHVVAVKKEVATKKSRSVGRLGSRKRIMPFNALTIDHDKTQSMIEDNLESDEEGEVSRTLDIDSRILKSRHFEKSIENRIIEESSPELSSYKKVPTFGSKLPIKKITPRVDWKKFILNEKAKLEKLHEIFHHRKQMIRVVQEELKKEQNLYKIEHNNIKNNPSSSNTLRLKVDIMKKSINVKIKNYNDKLTELRSEESIHKTKKILMHKLESTFAKFINDEIDEGTLNRYYQEYCELKINDTDIITDAKLPESTMDDNKSLTSLTTIDTDANRLLRRISKVGIKESSQRASSTRRDENPYNKENVSLQANISIHNTITDVRDSLDAQRSTKSHSSFFDERYQAHDRLKIANLKQRSEKYFKQYDEMMRKYGTTPNNH